MRYYCLLTAFIFTTMSSFGQNTFPSSGNVGIGTTSPQSTLDVRGDVKIGATLISSSNSPFSGSTILTSGSGYHNIFGVDGTWTSKYFGIKTNGDFVMVGGKFGIGTSSPAQNFVVSNSNQDGFEVILNQPAGTVGLQSFNRTTSTYAIMRFDASQYFFPGGNVGIGTTSPTEKLSVKGKIRAQEIKVEVANWSDFVFDKDYKLPTLQETEKHIKEKGHLPGIPSASEVKANGVDLGDMNAKLLQKIEELTLYLIEMKKNSEQQQDQIYQLSKSNLELKHQMKQIKLKQ